MSGRLPYQAFGWLTIISSLVIICVNLFMEIVPISGDMVAFNETNRTALVTGYYSMALMLPVGVLQLVFLSVITRAFEDAARGWLWLLVLASGLMSQALAYAASGVFFIAQPLAASEVGQAGLLLMNKVGYYAFYVGLSFQTLEAAVIANAVLRLRFLPAAFGYLAWLVAIVSALGTLPLVVTSGPFSANGAFGMFVLYTGAGFPVWLLLTAIYWVVRAPKAQVAPIST